MKKAVVFILVAALAFVNSFSFISCRAVEEEIDEVRACWVSSVGNLDFPSAQGLSVSALKAEIREIVDNCADMGLNTIFFQARPMGDALYPSEIFPWSVYLTGTQGVAPADSFDPLSYFVETAHKAGIELHAWLNPYRIGTGSRVWENLAAENPAALHPEYTVTCDSGVYYNPGLPEARALILSGIEELVRGYEIDGIHFDDYFYPYNMSGFDDSAAYKKYGGGLSLADFRRQSVDRLIQDAGTLIKTLDPDVQFGVSPFGIWANQSVDPAGSATSGMSSYTAIYSDSKKWVEEGWLDYICPQIYWSFDLEAAPYDVLVDWWDALCRKSGTRLYIGIAFYKVGTDEVGWDEGTIMERQLRYAAEKESYAGHCFFRYGMMAENPLGALDSIQAYYGADASVEEERPNLESAVAEDQEVEYLPLKTSGKLKVTAPQSGSTISGGGVSVTGVCAPGARVEVNGVAAVVSSSGFFSAYITLEQGANTIAVSSGGARKTLTVYRSEGGGTTLPDESSAYPRGKVCRGAGETICFSLRAPSGAAVALSNGSLTIPLSPSESDPTLYTARWQIPAFPAGDKLTLTGFYYTVDATSFDTDLELNLYAEGYREEMILQENAYLFDESAGGSQMDHDPLSKGAQVTVVALEGTRALLENGYWVEQELLGTEEVLPGDAAGYAYEILRIAAEESPAYYTYCDGTALEVVLTAGLTEEFDTDCAQGELRFTVRRNAGKAVISITSSAGRDIAGYEVLPQKNSITVYVRFHREGLAGKTILLDAGHGGEDSGALGPGGSAYPAESTLNLALANLLKQELEAAGATVLMTRSSDETVTLEQRVEIAAEQAPDLFLSLHHNAGSQTTDYNRLSGALALYSSPVSAGLAEELAQTLWDGVGEKAAVSRRQSLHVCRQTRYPAVLIEAGYLCNPVEYEMLCSEDNALKIAQNIVAGLENYFVTVCS